jgi:hypothetical protein
MNAGSDVAAQANVVGETDGASADVDPLSRRRLDRLRPQPLSPLSVVHATYTSNQQVPQSS